MKDTGTGKVEIVPAVVTEKRTVKKNENNGAESCKVAVLWVWADPGVCDVGYGNRS